MASSVDPASVSAKIFALMKQMELIAEDILADRQKMIELDRRRQKNREALRALKQTSDSVKKATAASPQPAGKSERNASSSVGTTTAGASNVGGGRTWCVYGSSFVRTDTSRAVEMITKEQQDIETEIELVRKRMKKSMQELSELEGRKGIQDFELKPLSRAEKDAIHKIIGA